MDRDGFYADFGPSTVERNAPMFLLQNWCCWWSGQSWPYATTQTLKGLANFLQADGQTLTSADYVEMLGIYDDRGGVQPPEKYEIQYWDGQDWAAVEDVRLTPEQPLGSQWNSAAFRPVTSRKVRIVFTHRGDARSGVTEVMVWNE